MSHQTEPSIMPQQTVEARRMIVQSLVASPLSSEELGRNLGLYILPMELRRFLFLNSLYQRILDVPGIIVEFGVRWGQDLAILQALRSIYEPYNHRRIIVGFDTFEGFQSVHEKDGTAPVVATGAYGVTANYESQLDALLGLKETQSPLSHIKKHRLLKGDAAENLPLYLKEHPETIVSLAYFDMDLYEPTAKCLNSILERVTRGSVIGFDELNHSSFPGETTAVREILGLNNIRLQRNVWCGEKTFFVVE